MDTEKRVDEELVPAKELKVLPPGTAYKMARANLIPFYQVGVEGRGIRFKRSEVLAALRRPIQTRSESGK
jgi:excisionase family DNA binding protein